MGLRRALHVMGIGALTGALLLGSGPMASADDIRDRQWDHDFFAAKDIWEHATGKGVTVAVVDTGVNASHPDLKGSVIRGKDYTNGKGTSDNGRHGTSMASVIAGHGHGPGNKQGVMGLAPDAKIMPLTTAIGTSGSDQHRAIRYAVDHGAKVINLSYDGPRIFGEQKAIEYAISKDVVVVAAAGNVSGKLKHYPAAYPGVVSVGGLGRDGKLWENSSWGSNVSLLAPAEDLVSASTKQASGYGISSGTSLATAIVSASAALVREEHPDLTAGQVINRLIKSAKPLADAKGNHGKLPDEKFGYGVVRPFRAVTYDYPAGPEAGPLAQPDGKTSNSSAGNATSGSSSSPDEGSSGWMYVLGPPIVLFGLIALVLVGLAVLIVVLVKRKDRNDRVGDPWAAGGGPGVPPQQFSGQHFPGQQQPPAPSGQFGQAPPPPPNQPPSQ